MPDAEAPAGGILEAQPTPSIPQTNQPGNPSPILLFLSAQVGGGGGTHPAQRSGGHKHAARLGPGRGPINGAAQQQRSRRCWDGPRRGVVLAPIGTGYFWFGEWDGIVPGRRQGGLVVRWMEGGLIRVVGIGNSAMRCRQGKLGLAGLSFDDYERMGG